LTRRDVVGRQTSPNHLHLGLLPSPSFRRRHLVNAPPSRRPLYLRASSAVIHGMRTEIEMEEMVSCVARCGRSSRLLPSPNATCRCRMPQRAQAATMTLEHISRYAQRKIRSLRCGYASERYIDTLVQCVQIRC
jgi:hypothetical protein